MPNEPIAQRESDVDCLGGEVLSLLMNLDDAHALVAHLKREENNPEMSYWIAPVIEFGRLI